MKSARLVFALARSLLAVQIGAGTELGDGSAQAAPEVTLHFKQAPLESVLNYLSDAAGFIIDLQTTVSGKVTVWSNQPVTREEALHLVTAALDNHGYAAVRNGRTLTIWKKEEAKKRDLPVILGNDPNAIPKTHEMVTQIVPVRYISAVQVSRDLQQLLPDSATMTANEGGNALIITDTQAHIRRLVEIIHALDTAVASVSTLKVYPLRYGDAKTLAGILKDLFTPQDASRTGNSGQGQPAVVNTFQTGGGAPGGFPGGPGGFGQQANPGAATTGGDTAPTPRIVAVAEERSNSVVINAPQSFAETIDHLVHELDVNVQDMTEIRVFHLKNADSQETADLLNTLLGDSSNSRSGQDNNRAQMQFGGGFPGGGGPFGGGGFPGGGQFGGGNTGRTGSAANSGQSARMQKQALVVAVAEPRTGSVIVTAGRELLKQIEPMIRQLDADPARKQTVFVFNAEHGDPDSIAQVLQGLFPAGSSSSSALSSRQQSAGNALSNRATQNQNQGMNRTSGNSAGGGLGSGGLGGGLGGTGR